MLIGQRLSMDHGVSNRVGPTTLSLYVPPLPSRNLLCYWNRDIVEYSLYPSVIRTSVCIVIVHDVLLIDKKIKVLQFMTVWVVECVS